MGNRLVLRRIVSGGQTGVDRAALDAAMQCGFEAGGWCPRGRRSLDGGVPDRYPLKEARTESYPVRTELNVRDSDATLILWRGVMCAGSRMTASFADRMGRPLVLLRMGARTTPARPELWLAGQVGGYPTLNVAGPAEEHCPGVYKEARAVLVAFLEELRGTDAAVHFRGPVRV